VAGTGDEASAVEPVRLPIARTGPRVPRSRLVAEVVQFEDAMAAR